MKKIKIAKWGVKKNKIRKKNKTKITKRKVKRTNKEN